MWGASVRAAERTVFDARATRIGTRAMRVWARQVRDDAAVLIAHSLALRGRRGLSGGSDIDSSLIASLVVDVPMCVDCIARKTEFPRWRVDDAVRQITEKGKVTSAIGRCGVCLKETVVHRFE
jgi:hypothetical protein